jgi:hypothetical protein
MAAAVTMERSRPRPRYHRAVHRDHRACRAQHTAPLIPSRQKDAHVQRAQLGLLMRCRVCPREASHQLPRKPNLYKYEVHARSVENHAEWLKTWLKTLQWYSTWVHVHVTLCPRAGARDRYARSRVRDTINTCTCIVVHTGMIILNLHRSR